jgi:hypothetical protein
LWLRARRLDALPSALGAGVFAYGGYTVSQMVHLGVVSGLAWMPLGLWGIDEAVDRLDWRPLWKTALASAMCFLAGYPGSWVVYCANDLRLCPGQPCPLASCRGSVRRGRASLLLSMAQLLPRWKQGRSCDPGEVRWRPDKLARPDTLPRAELVRLQPAVRFAFSHGFYLYLGLSTIFAIGWALRRRILRPYRQPLIAAAFCMLLATNPFFLVYRVMEFFPFLIRTAQTYNFYEGVAAMAALITAIGLHDFLAHGTGKAAPRWVLPTTIAALAAWSTGKSASGGMAARSRRAVTRWCRLPWL